jgi:signal transduction histidine kinase
MLRRPFAFASRGGRKNAARSSSLTAAVTKFALSGLVVVTIVGVVEAILLTHSVQTQAIDNARNVTEVVAHGVAEPALTNGVMSGDAAALARLDRTIRARVLNQDLVRVKLWTADGRIVYSDEPRLVGATYPLGREDRAAIQSGGVDAEVSDLSRPENRFERQWGKLLEVYLPVQTPGGQRLLFEAYFRFSSVAASARRSWLTFGPVLLLGLLVLWAVQTPLALSLARRVRDGQRERVDLLRQAVEASDAERRRIAGDVHDGAVQNLAGTSFSLAAAADRAGEATSSELASVLRDAAASTRQTMRELRTLLVEIYPPNLQAAGLEAALSDLLAPVVAGGAAAHLDVEPRLGLQPEREALLFRSAQEALRNVASHAEASRVDVRVVRDDGRVLLEVDDDGIGFVPANAHTREQRGHVGLRLLVESKPGEGTRVHVEVPAE